jgi:hypothetical protein
MGYRQLVKGYGLWVMKKRLFHNLTFRIILVGSGGYRGGAPIAPAGLLIKIKGKKLLFR